MRARKATLIVLVVVLVAGFVSFLMVHHGAPSTPSGDETLPEGFAQDLGVLAGVGEQGDGSVRTLYVQIEERNSDNLPLLTMSSQPMARSFQFDEAKRTLYVQSTPGWAGFGAHTAVDKKILANGRVQASVRFIATHEVSFSGGRQKVYDPQTYVYSVAQLPSDLRIKDLSGGEALGYLGDGGKLGGLRPIESVSFLGIKARGQACLHYGKELILLRPGDVWSSPAAHKRFSKSTFRNAFEGGRVPFDPSSANWDEVEFQTAVSITNHGVVSVVATERPSRPNDERQRRPESGEEHAAQPLPQDTGIVLLQVLETNEDTLRKAWFPREDRPHRLFAFDKGRNLLRVGEPKKEAARAWAKPPDGAGPTRLVALTHRAVFLAGARSQCAHKDYLYPPSRPPFSVNLRRVAEDDTVLPVREGTDVGPLRLLPLIAVREARDDASVVLRYDKHDITIAPGEAWHAPTRSRTIGRSAFLAAVEGAPVLVKQALSDSRGVRFTTTIDIHNRGRVRVETVQELPPAIDLQKQIDLLGGLFPQQKEEG